MSRSERWPLVDRLVGEQKYEAAFGELGAIRAEADGDPRRDLEWTEALSKQAKLRSARDGLVLRLGLPRSSTGGRARG